MFHRHDAARSTVSYTGRVIARIERIVERIRGRDARVAAVLDTYDLLLKTVRLPKGPAWILVRRWGTPVPQLLIEAFDGIAPELDELRIFTNWRQFWRAAVAELFEAGQWDILDRRLAGALGEYDPVLYLYWGRLQQLKGNAQGAGLYVLLSGCYEPSDGELVERTKRRFRKSHPNQVIAEIPRPCRKVSARMAFSQRVWDDFREIPHPPWWRQPLRNDPRERGIGRGL
jgi:hypothetical protein